MKVYSYRCHIVLVVLGLLGSVAHAADPITFDTILGNSSAPKRNPLQETHGLLAHRFTNPATETPIAPVLSEVEDQPQPAPSYGPTPFQPASWNNWAVNSELASGIGPETQVMPESGSPSIASDCCCDPLWCHRCGVFADLLYLRPGNIDVIYAVEQTGPLPTDSQTGPTGRVGFDAALGYRLGATWALSDCSSLQLSYLWFQDDTQNTITATPGNVLVFQQGLPTIPNVGATSIVASATYDIRFQQLDFDYRSLLYGTYDSAVNYFAGLRYANLKQDFRAQEDIGAPSGLTAAGTHLSFDGFGIGFGVDGMRRAPGSGLLVYGRSSASFVSGEFKATYRETSQFVTGAVGNNLTDFRVLTILQSEIGGGWQSQSGRLRATIGYQFAGWFNSLTTGSYILAVQNRQFNNPNETITFDGLVTRVLWQF